MSPHPKPYQKSNPNLAGTRDFKRLLLYLAKDDTLRVPLPFLATAARGTLSALWAWGFHEARDGDVTDLTAEDLEVLTGWPGDSELLLAALLRSGFITEEDGQRRFNGWEEWGGALYVEQVREAEAARKAIQRAKRHESEPVSHDVPPCPTMSQDVPTRREEKRREEKQEALEPLSTAQPTVPLPKVSRRAPREDFLNWWEVYGKEGSRADAEVLYGYWREHGAGKDELLTAAAVYRRHCILSDVTQKHGATFLAKPPKPNRWREWADREEHGQGSGGAAEREHEAGTARAIMFLEEERRGGSIDLGRGTATPRGLPAAELQSRE